MSHHQVHEVHQGTLARIGWIGTGVMGAPMAGHLLSAGHPIAVHTRSGEKAQTLSDAGATWAATPAQAAQRANIVCTNVGSPAEVEEVYFGREGVLSVVTAGQILIDFSTTKPALSRRIAAAASAQGAHALDAPVSGGDIGARNATLSIMVVGDAEAFARATPVLEKLGKIVLRQGEAGAGQRTKIVNQVLVAANTLAMCEALHFAAQAGLDVRQVHAAVSGGAAASWALTNLGSRVLDGNFDTGFFAEHLVKDLRIAQEEAEELGVSLPLLQRCLAQFERFVEAGHGRRGTHGVYLLYRDQLVDPKVPVPS